MWERAIDPRFINNVLRDNDIIRQSVLVLPDQSTTCSAGNEPERSFYESWLDEDCLPGYPGEEITMFRRATVSRNKTANLLPWWKEREGRYPAISPIAREVHSIQASSVATESTFSQAGMIVEPSHSSFRDYIIIANILVKSGKNISTKLRAISWNVQCIYYANVALFPPIIITFGCSVISMVLNR